MHYELKDLRLFLAIVEAGNLSQGALMMHMTASSASYRLKNLEYTVGSFLFVRTPKGMTLTAAGEVLAKHAKKLLADVQVMHTDLGTYSKNLRGRIRLIANSSSLNSFIIPSLTRFLVTNESINVELKEKESPSIVQAVEEGIADIGVGAGLDPKSGISRKLYAHDRLVCVVSTEHPLASASQLSFEEVLSYDLVSIEESSSNFLYLSNQARLVGKPMRIRVHIHNFNSLLYLVQEGVGAAIIPASVVDNYNARSKTISIPLTDTWAARNLYLVYKDDLNQTELVKQFAQVLLDDPQVLLTRLDGKF